MTKIKNAYRFIRYVLLQRHFYGITAPLRVLPDFFVIGVVRSGTTSLYHYLDEHPCITKSAYDELGFFDDNYHLGLNWYRSMFPTKSHKEKIIKKFGKFLTYDVTPFYIYNKISVERIFKAFPNSKIIAVLRNPIDRAYSHYHLSKRAGVVTKSFDDVVKEDMKKIKLYEGTNEKLTDYYFKDVGQNSYLARGFYAEQLKSWFKIFNKNNILIISSENLATKTQNTLDIIFKFLNLEPEKISNLEKVNVAKYPPMSDNIRKELVDYFSKHNENLFNLINLKFDWS